jgi:hypothetical protein
MIPGLVTKLSEDAVSLTATLSPKTDIVRVTSTATTTVLVTITPPYQGFSGLLILINLSGGNITTTTAGNIQTAVTVGQNVATLLVFSKALGKYVPGALA